MMTESEQEIPLATKAVIGLIAQIDALQKLIDEMNYARENNNIPIIILESSRKFKP